MLLVPLLSRTRAALDMRENLRFLLDRDLALLRSTLLGLGRRLGLGEEVFSLTLEELREAVKGSLSGDRARELDQARRDKEGALDAPPDFFIDGRPQDDFEPEGDYLQGIGTSPGRAAGQARRVDPATEPELEEGDIVVARSLDPGQAPLLGLAGGVVLQEGGLLNHCSIVARELGVPMVVGVKSAQRIATGQRLSLDGSSGRVYFADAESETG
jgi:pyruvate,water dikinase